jgi:hypothetical protein
MAADGAGTLGPLEVSDLSSTRQVVNGTFSSIQNVGDVIADFTKEFRSVWETLSTAHSDEEKCVDQIKALLVEVDQHKASLADSLVRYSVLLGTSTVTAQPRIRVACAPCRIPCVQRLFEGKDVVCFCAAAVRAEGP